MRPLLTAEEMRRADDAAIHRGTAAKTLMERAGAAVARVALRMAGRRYGARIAVVCGPGNNGGDGYVTARLLRAQGAAVTCLAIGDPSGLGEPAGSSYRRLLQAGVVVRPFAAGPLSRCELIVDAIFGTGFHGEPRGSAREAIVAIAQAREQGSVAVLAVDVPSGVGGLGPFVRSDVTLAIAAEKIETAVLGEATAGRVEVADIGIEVGSAQAWMAGPEDLSAVGPRDPGVHKWTRSVAILAGSDAMTGAPLLSARGAFRAGAGYVTLGTTPGVEAVARRLLPEAVVRVGTQEEVLGADAVNALKETIERAGAVAAGPGIGTGDRQRDFVLRLLEEVEQPLVLDADGLNVLQGDADALRSRRRPLAITPHAGELARLLGRPTDEIDRDRVAAVEEASERFACTVLLKGPRTLSHEPGKGLVVNPTGGAELATAGTGDVLTGIAAALASGGDDAFVPAWQAAYLHGHAAGIAAHRKGSVGLVAWDVAEALPQAIAELSSS